MSKTIKFTFRTDNSITKEFTKYVGKPNAKRNKRALIKEFNPLHFAFGDVRPVWKTWQSYAQNMQLLEDDDHA